MKSASPRAAIVNRLRRGRNTRQAFVESHITKSVAFQIRAIRDGLEWSQEELAKRLGVSQNSISRLESPTYGRPTLTTLRRLAAAFDVGLVVRFVPFGEMIDWVSGTPRVVSGLSTQSLAVPDFENDPSVIEKSAEEFFPAPTLAEKTFRTRIVSHGTTASPVPLVKAAVSGNATPEASTDVQVPSTSEGNFYYVL